MSRISPYHHPSSLSTRLRYAYAEIVQRYWDDGNYRMYLVTLVFNSIAGPECAKINAMEAEAEHFYRPLITACVRKPRSPAQQIYMPIMLGHPDLPIFKGLNPHLFDVTINGGLHMHFIVIIHIGSRLRVGLDEHVHHNKAIYMGTSGVKRNIHVREIHRTPEKATEYVFKFLERDDFGCEFVFIRPKTLSELSVKGILPRPAPEPRMLLRTQPVMPF